MVTFTWTAKRHLRLNVSVRHVLISPPNLLLLRGACLTKWHRSAQLPCFHSLPTGATGTSSCQPLPPRRPLPLSTTVSPHWLLSGLQFHRAWLLPTAPVPSAQKGSDHKAGSPHHAHLSCSGNFTWPSGLKQLPRHFLARRLSLLMCTDLFDRCQLHT